MIAKLLLAAALLILLTSCHEPGHVEEWGAPPPAKQQRQDDGCPPNVAWVHPGAGTVTKVKDCPGFFGTTVRYAFVDSGPRQVWMADPGGRCQRGDDWTDAAGCE